MTTLDIKGLDRAAVLAALHAAAIAGALHGGYKNHPPIDPVEAEDLLAETETFQYVDGRAMFLTFDGDQVDVHGYDQKNGGPGTAARALAPLLERAKAKAELAVMGVR